MGREIDVVNASTNREIDEAFATFKQNRDDALLVAPDTLMVTRRVQIAMLAVRYAIPLIAPIREFAVPRRRHNGTIEQDQAHTQQLNRHIAHCLFSPLEWMEYRSGTSGCQLGANFCRRRFRP